MGLVSRPHLVNLFNMPAIAELPCPQEVSQSLGPGPGEWKLTRFGRTPPVSTIPPTHTVDAKASLLRRCQPTSQHGVQDHSNIFPVHTRAH
jgi:hypothetical protein